MNAPEWRGIDALPIVIGAESPSPTTRDATDADIALSLSEYLIRYRALQFLI